MIDYITGANGFIGRNLMRKIGPRAQAMPHEGIIRTNFKSCSKFYFLCAYGNMASHKEVGEMLLANVSLLSWVIGSYLKDVGNQSIDHFVYVSSSSVGLPVQTPYSRLKRAGEEIVMASGLPATIIRPFSVIGVGEQKEHLIPTLIRSCLDGEPMTFSPRPVHDFVDVMDVVTAIAKISSRPEAEISCETHELGSGESYTNEAVREVVENICGAKANIVEINSLRSYDCRDWVSRDPSEYFKSTKTLDQSVKEMVEAHRSGKI